MEKDYASNLLRINLGASATEVEAAYRKRRDEVQKRLQAARDRNTRTRCEREFFALEQARNILLAETEDVTIKPEAVRVEPEATRVEPQALRVKLEAAGVDSEVARVAPEAPLIERVVSAIEHVAPVIERVAPAIEHAAPVIERVAPAIEHAAPVIERVAPVIQRVAPVIETVAPAVEHAAPVIERVAPTVGHVAPVIERVAPAVEHAAPVIERVAPAVSGSTHNRPGSTPSIQKRWLALAGITFILASVSAIVFFQPHPTDRPKTGRFVLNTVPHNADIWLDGAPRGKTPLILENLEPGDRRLTIKLPGYRDEELIVSIKPGAEGSTRIVQLVPVEQPSPTPTARPSPTSQPKPIIVPPTASPTVAPSPRSSTYPGERYPQTRERFLTEADVANLDYAELRYAINEMYARYGAPFLSEPDFEKQFRKFAWYHPIHDLKPEQIEASFFSAIEKKNVDILARFRDQKRPK
jgi:hypothetical protein